MPDVPSDDPWSSPLLSSSPRVTLCDLQDDGLDWIPVDGCRLLREELVEVFETLRALIDGTEGDEPNRAHAVSIAYVLAEAIEREGDGS